MNNYEDLTKASEVAKNSIGSVEAEMDLVMNTYEKKVAQLKNAWQEMLSTTMESDSIKHIVEQLTDLCKMMEKVGGLKPILTGVATMLGTMFGASLIGSIGRVKSLFDELSASVFNATGKTMSLTQAMSAIGSCAGAIGLVVGAVTTLTTALVEAKREKQRLHEETISKAGEEARTYADSANQMEDYVTKYQKIYSSTDDVKTKKEELSALQDELTNKYGREGEALDVLNGKYQETIDKLTELTQKEREEKKLDLERDMKQSSDKANNALTSNDNWGTGGLLLTDTVTKTL